jgi:DNA-directed RNA polymerase specialized sigma24 family protein
LPRFDPDRASLATFIECIIGRRVCSLVRSANRLPQSHPLNVARNCAVYLEVRRYEVRIDIAGALRSANSADRRLALVLMQHSPSEACLLLGVARSTVYEGIRRLRLRFAAAGIGQYCAGSKTRRKRPSETRVGAR